MILRLSLAALLLAMSCACPSPSLARSYPLEAGQASIGRLQNYTARREDTLLDIARNFDIGYTEIVIANPGIDPWLPGEGRTVTIPAFFLLPNAPRQGIVVNILKQRLFFFPPDGKTVETYPIGVGGEGRSTPLGVTRIVRKQPHPAWYPPPSILAEDPELPKVVPPGPDNPMGDFALYLGWPTYTIHGTDKPYGIGRNSSHGCLRLYPEDIEQLFREVPVGTQVRVVSEEAEWAWIDNELYLAIFPTKEQTDEIDIGHRVAPVPPDGLKERLAQMAGEQASRIDWELVEELGRERSGIPTQITLPPEDPRLIYR